MFSEAVYNVQNRTASKLAKVLRSVYRTEDGKQVAIESSVAPKHETAVVGTEGANIEVSGPRSRQQRPVSL